MHDRQHPIINRPWEWEIARLEWVAADETSPSHLDVTFTRGGESRKLRFTEPQNVSVGFDDGHNRIECGEMLILDIADRQLDGLNVQVTDGGASGTPLRLYAKSVIEVALTIDAAQQIVGRERRKPLNCGLRISDFEVRI